MSGTSFICGGNESDGGRSDGPSGIVENETGDFDDASFLAKRRELLSLIAQVSEDRGTATLNRFVTTEQRIPPHLRSAFVDSLLPEFHSLKISRDKVCYSYF